MIILVGIPQQRPITVTTSVGSAAKYVIVNTHTGTSVVSAATLRPGAPAAPPPATAVGPTAIAVKHTQSQTDPVVQPEVPPIVKLK